MNNAFSPDYVPTPTPNAKKGNARPRVSAYDSSDYKVRQNSYHGCALPTDGKPKDIARGNSFANGAKG